MTAVGVQSSIHTPHSGDVTGIDTYSTNTDVNLGHLRSDTNTLDFVQFGWYVGTGTGGLDTVDVPHAWLGETRPDGSERLMTIPDSKNGQVGWNTYHNYKIVPDAQTGGFDFLLDGTQVGQTGQPHSDTQTPGFNAEIDESCTTMDGEAFDQAGMGTPTLEWRRNGNLFFFDNIRVFQNAPKDSAAHITLNSSYSTNATDYAYSAN